jgi:VWFA-related protein
MMGRRAASALLVALTAMVGLCAQQTGTNEMAGQNGTFTLTVNSQLVIETVVVKDKQGNFVPGLTAKDFTVTEDGQAQTIRIFEHQALSNAVTPMPVTPPNDEQITLYKKLTRTQIAPESPGKPQYSDHRLLALYFDMTALPPTDQLRALTAAEKFVGTQMSPADLVAILRYQGGSVEVLQDFTADRNRLLSILETMIVGEGQGSVESVDDASSADTGRRLARTTASSTFLTTIGSFQRSRLRRRCWGRSARRSR